MMKDFKYPKKLLLSLYLDLELSIFFDVDGKQPTFLGLKLLVIPDSESLFSISYNIATYNLSTGSIFD